MLKNIKKLLLAGAIVGTCQAAWAKTELSMYYPVAVGGPLTKVVDGLVADFEKQHPDIDVTAIYAGNYNDTRVKALAAMKTDNPPQLSVMFSIDLHELRDLDVIVPFDDVVENDADKAWLNGFYPTLMENSQADGKTWGIPFQRSTIVMYYNKDLFKAAGLNPEQPPKTWAELVEVGKKLTKSDGSQWGLMIPSTGYPYWMFGALCKQNGQILMNQAGTETYFNKPAVIEALSFWQSLGAEHKIMPKGTIEWGTLRQNFLEQKTAIMWNSTGNLTAVKNNAAFDFGVAMLPKQKNYGSPTGGGNFYLFKNSTPEQKTAAMKLIKFMTSPENAAKWSIDTGYMAVSQAAYETPALQQYVNDFPPAAVARDQLQHATAELSTHQAGRVRKLLDDAIQATLTEQKSAADALNAAQKQAERTLKPYQQR